MKKFLLYSWILVLFVFKANAQTGLTLKTKDLSITLGLKGEIETVIVNGIKISKDFNAFTSIEGTKVESITSKKIKTGLEVVKQLTSPAGSCVLTERFYPTRNSIRWEMEITGKGDSWSSNIGTYIHYPVSEKTTYWTAWGAPQIDIQKVKDPEFKKELDLMHTEGMDWLNPLISVPFSDATYYFGALIVTNKWPETSYWPYFKNVISIPLVAVIEKEKKYGVSFIVSPEDDLLDMALEIKGNGDIAYKHFNHKISNKNTLKFAMDIVPHASDWRTGLSWMTKRYKEYFDPSIPGAFELNGTGAYSNEEVNYDVQKMKDMAFSTNWQASFDFVYMGMFIPPIAKDTVTWLRFGGGLTSLEQMNDYAGRMEKNGFHVLSYFNVTEFGAHMKYPPPPVSTTEADRWKNADDYLYQNLPSGILYVPKQMNLKGCTWCNKTRNDAPFYTWRDGIVMDCGDKKYSDFLLDQAKKHVKYIPNASGICIDRMDWLRMYNVRENDGASWYEGGPARSILNSWRGFMKKLIPIFHDAGKVIFLNNHTKRIDAVRNTDGFFDEFTQKEAPLNLTAFLAVNKPFLGWTPSKHDVDTQGVDNFFQKYLYMGAFPMCPFPANHHSINPNDTVDMAYLDYGEMMKQMKYRRWFLKTDPVSVKDNDAKANIFTVPDGYLIPVVYGLKESITLNVTAIDTKTKWNVYAYYPGKKEPVKLKYSVTKNNMELTFPLERRCAVIKIISGKE